MQITYNIVEVKVPYNLVLPTLYAGACGSRNFRRGGGDTQTAAGVQPAKVEGSGGMTPRINFEICILNYFISWFWGQKHIQKNAFLFSVFFTSLIPIWISRCGALRSQSPTWNTFPIHGLFKWLDNRTGLLYSPKLPLKTKFGNAARNLQATALHCSKVNANPRGQRSVHGCYEIVHCSPTGKGCDRLVNLSPACLRTHVPDVLILLTPDTVEIVSLYITVTVCTDSVGCRYKVSS